MSSGCCSTQTFLTGTQIEIVFDRVPRGNFKHVLFDFDGTISLIRQGWQEVMIPMMVEIIAQTPHAESMDDIRRVVVEFVTRLTGKQTMYQMIQLTEEIAKRGGKPREALEYKHMYNELLLKHIHARRDGLKSGAISREDLLVPGAAEMLDDLRRRGLTLYCASGTDEPYMIEEAKMLGVADRFNGGLYGALDDYKKFSKHMLITKILADNILHGAALLTFGDGFVEIEDTKQAGGMAVGVASDEVRRQGIDEWKRDRLIEAGADLIIPDFSERKALMDYLFPR